MKSPIPLIPLLLAAGLGLSGPLHAEKPEWAGGGKHEKKDKHDERRQRDERGKRDDYMRVEDRAGGYRDQYRFFDDGARRIVIDYYTVQVHAGHCPPGLKKKKNACVPPGQAKKWRLGHPLPAGVVYYPLPPELLVRLPPPPPRHRYVQIAGDILLIAVGTSMVVDAIEDILR